MPMGYRIGSWGEPPEDGTGEPAPTSVTVAEAFPKQPEWHRPRRRLKGRWAEKHDTELLLRRLGKARKRIPATPPVHHYAGPASDTSFTQASDLRITPDRNHPAKDLGPWYLRDRFAVILEEYGVPDPHPEPLGPDDVNRRIDGRLGKLNVEAERRSAEEIEERADLREDMERYRRRYRRQREEKFLNVGSW